MTDTFIPRGIAESMQGKTLLAQVYRDGYAYLVEGQGLPMYILPKGSFSIFVSRAAALAQAKRIAPHKVKRVKKGKYTHWSDDPKNQGIS